MGSAVEHANRVTRNYGVEVMSINIISATPVDSQLTRALATGAVASAEALQAETQARGQARAVAIAAEAEAARTKIAAQGRSWLARIVPTLTWNRSWFARGPLDALPESMLARSSGPEAILDRSGAPRSARSFGQSRGHVG